ncbi:MAG: hypothetical protein JNK85_22380 [Verrucomicrobiales bacterium]|nr:hypothetical protein [Verrucomicrobiales bacterium]
MKTALSKSFVLPLVAALPLVASTGCSISLGGAGESRARQEVPKPPPPVVVLSNNSEDSATLAEIDAAAGLSFEGNRAEALKKVASRPAISPAVQTHLVNTSLRQLSFDGNKVEVLLSLIANPSFSPSAKEAILRQLNLLSFDGNRTQVLGAIQARHPNG